MKTIIQFDTNRSLLEHVAPGETVVVEIPVTQTIVTRRLSIFTHVIRGTSDGPVLGIMANIHGDEAGTLPVLNRLVNEIDAASLTGTVVVVPVANPPALAGFSRTTPEQHGNPDLHKVFPGNANGNLTQMLAATIAENVLSRLDALVDMHCGGSGGRVQRRVDFDGSFGKDVRAQSLALCRAVGTTMIHENNLSNTASAWLNKQGVPTVNMEIGGSYLSPVDANQAEEFTLVGLRRVMGSLGMIQNEPPEELKQLLFSVDSRFEANPTIGGFVESYYQSMDDLDTEIEQGTLLGRIIDPYTLDVVEELRAPVSGRLFFARYSGMIDSGTKCFAIAEEKTATWL